MKKLILLILLLIEIGYSQLQFPVSGRLNKMRDVDTSSLADGDGLIWNSTTLKWERESMVNQRSGLMRFSAIDLDGSTEYMSRTYTVADSFLNMNGYERIQNANSTGFTANTGTWTNPVGSNTTITRNTTTPLFEAGDGLIIATGAGDTITNYVGLPINVTSVHGTTSGNKYTVEFWYKNAHAAGGDLIILRWGNNQKSWAATSTLTKAVFNFESSSFTALEDTIKLYTSSASGDTLWIDSVNISQAYDVVISGWVYPRVTSTLQYLFGKNSTQTIKRWGGYINSNALGAIAHDSVNLVYFTTPISSGQWTYYQIIFDRTDSLILYINGMKVNGDIMTNVGRMDNKISPLIVGNGLTTSYTFSVYELNGLVGETRMTRFDNISSSTWTTAKPLATYNAYTLGRGFQDDITGGGKKIVVWYDWGVYDTDGNMLMDLSGNGYNLTGSNTTTADHVFWKR